MKKIPLSRGLFAVVDDADHERVIHHRWYAHKSGGGRIYAARRLWVDGRNTLVYMHHEIIGKAPGFSVDHINGDSLDNRRANLRICSYSENALNSPRGKKPGVFFCRTTGRYGARASLQGKRIFLGRHETFEEAAAAVERFRVQKPVQRAAD